jgi:hypothetical protein
MTASLLASLSAADRALTSALHAAADSLDAFAASSLDAALARVEASANRVKDRLHAASAFLTTTCGGVLAEMTSLTSEIMGALAMSCPEPLLGVAAQSQSDAGLPATYAEFVTQEGGEEAMAQEMVAIEKEYAEEQHVATAACSPVDPASEACHCPKCDPVGGVGMCRRPAACIGMRAEAADPIIDLAAPPVVEAAAMICCVHNGPSVPACLGCAARAALFTPPTVEEVDAEMAKIKVTPVTADQPAKPARKTRRKGGKS